MEQALLVITNLPDAALAQTLARQLVEKKLAACVNIMPSVKSIYRWQGMIEEANEISLLIKTMQASYPQLEEAIKAAHPYDLPEIIALPIAAGWPGYLDWIAQETKKDTNV
jgi:periplasmic divalent cation tolerance protein